MEGKDPFFGVEDCKNEKLKEDDDENDSNEEDDNDKREVEGG